MQNKSQSIQNYKILLGMMDKYEELNLANYVEGKEDKMVFGNTQYQNSEGLTMKESVNKMNDGLKNILTFITGAKESCSTSRPSTTPST